MCEYDLRISVYKHCTLYRFMCKCSETELVYSIKILCLLECQYRIHVHQLIMLLYLSFAYVTLKGRLISDEITWHNISNKNDMYHEKIHNWRHFCKCNTVSQRCFCFFSIWGRVDVCSYSSIYPFKTTYQYKN